MVIETKLLWDVISLHTYVVGLLWMKMKVYVDKVDSTPSPLCQLILTQTDP